MDWGIFLFAQRISESHRRDDTIGHLFMWPFSVIFLGYLITSLSLFLNLSISLYRSLFLSLSPYRCLSLSLSLSLSFSLSITVFLSLFLSLSLSLSLSCSLSLSHSLSHFLALSLSISLLLSLSISKALSLQKFPSYCESIEVFILVSFIAHSLSASFLFSSLVLLFFSSFYFLGLFSTCPFLLNIPIELWSYCSYMLIAHKGYS